MNHTNAVVESAPFSVDNHVTTLLSCFRITELLDVLHTLHESTVGTSPEYTTCITADRLSLCLSTHTSTEDLPRMQPPLVYARDNKAPTVCVSYVSQSLAM